MFQTCPKSFLTRTRPPKAAQEKELRKETGEEETEVMKGTPKEEGEGDSIKVNIEELAQGVEKVGKETGAENIGESRKQRGK